LLNFLKIATLTVFIWFSQKLAHMIYVPQCKKNYGRDFRNFDFKIFGKILNLDFVSGTAFSSGAVYANRPPVVDLFFVGAIYKYFYLVLLLMLKISKEV